MMRILHLFDSSAGWEQRVAVRQLLERLPKSDGAQYLATIDRGVEDRMCMNGTPMPLLNRRLGLPALAGSTVRAYARRESIDLIHAWGIDAAAAARTAFPQGKPIAVTVFDPGVTERQVRILKTVGTPRQFAVVCAAGRVERRLVERGVPRDQCVILRPAVDFTVATAVAKKPAREELGLPQRGTVMVAPELPAEIEGQCAAIWSMFMRWYLEEEARLIVPGVSPDLPRLKMLAQASESPWIVTFTENKHPFEQLCALADYLVLGTTGETSTTAIAWAMACATTVIAPATHATTELLTNDGNAVLFKAPSSWRRRGAKICALYDEDDKLPQIKEVARGQAYELFSLRRAINQHRQLYENLLKGTAPATDITDPAIGRR